MKRYNEPITSKDANPLVEQRTTVDKDGVRFYYDLLARVGYLSSQGLTAARNWILPNRSGTIELKETPIRTASSATTLTLDDKTVVVTAGSFNIDILTATSNAGIVFEVINMGIGIVTLTPFGGQYIDGLGVITIPARYGLTIKCDGFGWIVISKLRQETLSSTQWLQTISTTTINTGTGLNLLTLITDANKLANGTDGGIHELGITTDKILTSWKGVRMTHHIRVLLTIATGTDQHYNLTIRRYADNSIVSSTKISRDADTGVVGVDFLTYTYGALDPFVTGGFYIQLDNNSGASVDLEDKINLLIITYFK